MFRFPSLPHYQDYQEFATPVMIKIYQMSIVKERIIFIVRSGLCRNEKRKNQKNDETGIAHILAG